MNALQRIGALYEEIDFGFDAQRNAALAAGNEPEVQRIEQKQLLNDQAHFVLCWGQLETELDEACRAAIRKRKASTSWEERRGFDFYNPSDKRLSGLQFYRRAAIVLDSNEGQGGTYAKVMSYYEIRNKIAHGRLEATRIDVSAVVADFYVIQGALTR